MLAYRETAVKPSKSAMEKECGGRENNRFFGLGRNVIKVIAGLAGLVATGFFVAGGFTYITSSGNPEQLDKAKRTLTWSAIGLAIVIAAFVISNIVTTLATQSFGG